MTPVGSIWTFWKAPVEVVEGWAVFERLELPCGESFVALKYAWSATQAAGYRRCRILLSWSGFSQFMLIQVCNLSGFVALRQLKDAKGTTTTPLVAFLLPFLISEERVARWPVGGFLAPGPECPGSV